MYHHLHHVTFKATSPQIRSDDMNYNARYMPKRERRNAIYTSKTLKPYRVI
jgi:hypothetical protein